jgi:tetratricopeptide (TPR) repeat protein
LKKEGNRSKLIAPLLNLGNVYSAQGKFGEAIDYWKRALRHANAVGNVNEQAQILNNLGIAEYSQGHYETALENYNKSLTLFTELQHPQGIILCTSNLGEIFLIQCLYEKAIMDWKKCLSFYEGIKDLQGLIETHNHLCQAYMAVGDSSAAQSHYQQAGQFLEQEGIEIQQGIHYYCAGILNFMEQQYDRAEENIRKAEAIFTTIGEHAFCCRTRLYRSRIIRAHHRFEEIRPALTEAIEIAEKYNLPLLQAEGLCELGRQTREHPLTQDKPTISYFRDAFNLIEKEIISEISWQVSFELGKEYIGRGLVSKGKAILHKSKAVLEYLGDQYTEDPLKASFWSSHGRSECLEEIKLLLSH